jgi:hypothetical protein
VLTRQRPLVSKAALSCRSVGLLTHGLIDRTVYYEHALVLALAPFMHPVHYEVADVSGRRDEEAVKEEGAAAAATG